MASQIPSKNRSRDGTRSRVDAWPLIASAQAARNAGSFEQEKLRHALATMETETPIGAYRVDGSGSQIAAQPLLVQVQRGRREIVWPEAYTTAKLRPYASPGSR